jgi:hypothetical protein
MRHGVHGFVLYLFDEWNDTVVRLNVIIVFRGPDPSIGVIDFLFAG